MALPIAGLDFVKKENLVVDPADAMPVAESLGGFAGAVERGHVEQQPLLREPVPQRALKAADRLAAQIRPGADLGAVPQQHVGPVAVVLRLDHGDQFAAAAGIAHGGGDDVDLAPPNLLQAVGASHRHQLHVDSDGLCEAARHVDVVAHERALGIAEAEGRVVLLNADDDVAAVLNLLQPVGKRRGSQACPGGEQGREKQAPRPQTPPHAPGSGRHAAGSGIEEAIGGPPRLATSRMEWRGSGAPAHHLVRAEAEFAMEARRKPMAAARRLSMIVA